MDSLAKLDSRPVLSALSRAVGTPAFSISQLLFVFVEGEENVGERERYRKLAGLPQNVRFMECGSCNEVARRVSAIKALANETEAGIRIGGVVDRDFRTDAEAQTFTDKQGVFVLPVHEAENFFLHPATLRRLLQQNGRENVVPCDLIRNAADGRAGSWIFQRAMSTSNARSLPDISVVAKDRAKGLAWAEFNADRDAAIQSIVNLSRFDADDEQKLEAILKVCAELYERKRAQETLWKNCEGKQILNAVAQETGFSGASALVQAAFALWSREGVPVPAEVSELRSYLAAI